MTSGRFSLAVYARDAALNSPGGWIPALVDVEFTESPAFGTARIPQITDPVTTSNIHRLQVVMANILDTLHRSHGFVTLH